MRIGEVAEVLGISTSALRYYERIGLLRKLGSVRANNNYRSYSEHDLNTLRMVIALKGSGLRLEDIDQLINGTPEGCGSLVVAIEKQLVIVQEAMESLVVRSQALKTLLSSCQSNCSQSTSFNCLKC